jgi:hypothetical protein
MSWSQKMTFMEDSTSQSVCCLLVMMQLHFDGCADVLACSAGGILYMAQFLNPLHDILTGY